jgi:hypothetical protein
MTASIRRPLGAALAGALSALLFITLLTVARLSPEPDVVGVATVIVALGAPVAIVLGWRFAPRVEGSHAFGLIAWMGTSAMLLGLLEVLAIVVGSGISAGPVILFIAFYAAAFGLIFGLVVTPFTIGCAAVWVGTFMLIERLTAAGKRKAPAVPGPRVRGV